MSLYDEIISHCSRNNILSKCSEKKCNLKDIDKKRFIIIDGDNIKKGDEKSVDCIIVDLNENIDNNYRIILCELTSGNKTFKDAREKFQNSGELIVKLMKQLNYNIFKIDCLLLGKIVKNGQVVSKRYLSQPLRINGYEKRNTLINQQPCGYSIKKLYD